MNIRVIKATEEVLLREPLLLLGDGLRHLGVPVRERLFRTQTECVMLFVTGRHADGVISVSIHIHCLLLQAHLVLVLVGRTVIDLQTALRLSLFARGGP